MMKLILRTELKREPKKIYFIKDENGFMAIWETERAVGGQLGAKKKRPRYEMDYSNAVDTPTHDDNIKG